MHVFYNYFDHFFALWGACVITFSYDSINLPKCISNKQTNMKHKSIKYQFFQNGQTRCALPRDWTHKLKKSGVYIIYSQSVA